MPQKANEIQRTQNSSSTWPSSTPRIGKFISQKNANHSNGRRNKYADPHQ